MAARLLALGAELLRGITAGAPRSADDVGEQMLLGPNLARLIGRHGGVAGRPSAAAHPPPPAGLVLKGLEVLRAAFESAIEPEVSAAGLSGIDDPNFERVMVAVKRAQDWQGHLLPQRGGGYRNDFIIQQQQQQQQQQLQQHAAMAGGDEDGDVSVSSGGSVGGLSAESGYSFHARDKQVGGGLVGD